MHGPLKVTLNERIKGFGTLIRLLRLINTCQKFFLRQGKKVHDCHKLDFKYFTLCEILGLYFWGQGSIAIWFYFYVLRSLNTIAIVGVMKSIDVAFAPKHKHID